MARKLLKDAHPLCAEILNGDHDGALDFIAQACKARLKNKFRKGMSVRLVGTKNPTLDGVIGIVTAVNQKTVAVGIGEKDEYGYASSYNVPPAMLEAVAA